MADQLEAAARGVSRLSVDAVKGDAEGEGDAAERIDWATFSLRQVAQVRTVGTGTFGRVMVVKEKASGCFLALKVLSIHDVLRLKQMEHMKNEKAILNRVRHPFIVRLYWTGHDSKFLYMLLEYVSGGEMFSYLRKSRSFSNEAARFFAAEILVALVFLHNLDIVYRDLKPENLLLDSHGHLKMTDFGFAKVLKDRTYTMCGTPEYLAPEVIQSHGYGKSVDFWALGILIYEMLVGDPPFYGDSTMNTYKKIISAKVEFPRGVTVDPLARDLIRRLLTSDRTRRLGSMKGGGQEVQQHRWFASLDWSAVERRELQPPIVPELSHPGDTRNYDKYDEQNWKTVPSANALGLEYFKDF